MGRNRQISVKVYGIGVKIFGRSDSQPKELRLDMALTIEELKLRAGIIPSKACIVFANGRKVTDGYIVNDRDEIKFLLPVSGG